MTDSQSAARDTFLKIRAAMLEIGQPSTAAEIAQRAKLPLQVVTRRLQSNGTGNMTAAYAWFAKGSYGWSLTSRGKESS